MSLTSAIKSVVESVKRGVGLKPPAKSDAATPAQEALNKRITAMTDAGGAYAKLWNPIAATGTRYLFGDQLSDAPAMPNGWTPVQDNQLWPLLTQEQAIMSQYKREFHASPQNPDDPEAVDLAKQASAAMNWIWKKGIKGDEVLLKAMMDGQTQGRWVTALWWDEQAKWDNDERRWKGKFRCDLISPGDFYEDPLGETRESWRFAYTLRRVPTMWAVAHWPEFAEQIKDAALKESELRRDDDKGGSGISGRLVPNQAAGAYAARDTSSPLNMGVNKARLLDALNFNENPSHGELTKDGKSLPAYVSVLEIVFCDEEMQHVEDMQEVPEEELSGMGMLDYREDVDPETQQPRRTQFNPQTGEPYSTENYPRRDMGYEAPKYPNGRHVIRFGLQPDGIVWDSAWSFEHWLWDDGLRGLLPHTSRGQNAVESAKDAQDLLNQIRGYVLNYLKNHAHCRTLIEENTLVGDEELENVSESVSEGPDRVVKIKQNRMNGYQTVAPPPLPAGLAEMVEKCEQVLRDTIGIQTVDQGRGDSKTLGQDVLNETKSRLRTAMQSLLMDDYCVRLMEHAWEIFWQKARNEQMIQILGEGGSTEGVALDPRILEEDFEVSLEVSTSMPFDRERRKQDALTLFTTLQPLFSTTGMSLAGYVLKWLLEAYDVPNAQGIVKELMQAAVAPPVPGETEAEVPPTTEAIPVNAAVEEPQPEMATASE